MNTNRLCGTASLRFTRSSYCLVYWLRQYSHGLGTHQPGRATLRLPPRAQLLGSQAPQHRSPENPTKGVPEFWCCAWRANRRWLICVAEQDRGSAPPWAHMSCCLGGFARSRGGTGNHAQVTHVQPLGRPCLRANDSSGKGLSSVAALSPCPW